MSNKQIIDDAITDAGTISKVTEGNTDIQVTSRTGKKIWTLSTLSRMIEQGFYRMFSTTALLMTYRPEYSPFAAKALDTKKVYVWESDAWVDTGLSELDLANIAIESVSSRVKLYASKKRDAMHDFYTSPLQYSAYWIDENNHVLPMINESIEKSTYSLDFFTPNTLGMSLIFINSENKIINKESGSGNMVYDFFTPQTIGVSVLIVNEKGQILSSGSGGGDSSLRVDLNEILTSQQKTENSPRFFRNGEQVMQRQNEYPVYYFQSYEELDCTSEGMYQKFDAIMADFPDLITRREIGRSVQDRPIYEYAVTPISWRTGATNPPEEKHIKPVTIAMYACVHGDEYAAVTGLYIWLQNLMRRWRELDWYGLHRYACQFRLVPCANPDGMTAKTNNNADNVNLNRNFASDWSSSAANAGPYAASEPETQALQAWFDETDASMFIDLHEGSTNELMWIGSWTDAGFGILNDAASRMVTFAFQNLDLASYVNADKTRMVYITKSVGGTAVNYLGNILQKNAILIESADRSHAMFRRNPQILREYSSKFISTIVECNRAKIQLNRSNGDFAH